MKEYIEASLLPKKSLGNAASIQYIDNNKIKIKVAAVEAGKNVIHLFVPLVVPLFYSNIPHNTPIFREKKK